MLTDVEKSALRARAVLTAVATTELAAPVATLTGIAVPETPGSVPPLPPTSIHT